MKLNLVNNVQLAKRYHHYPLLPQQCILNDCRVVGTISVPQTICFGAITPDRPPGLPMSRRRMPTTRLYGGASVDLAVRHFHQCRFEQPMSSSEACGGCPCSY